jgi:glycosyltransferase involved in cell wall biosynthesis
MKVAMLLDWFFPYAAAVANALADHTDVVVVTRDHGSELGVEGNAVAAKRALLDEGIRMLVISGKQRDPRSLADVARVCRLLHRFPPDVIHIQDHVDWRLYLLQRTLPEVPALLTIHDVVLHHGEKHVERMRIGVRRSVLRAVRRRAAAYIVHGEALADALRNQSWYGGQPVHVIPHGLLPYASQCAPLPTAPTVLFFGRIEYYKGLDLLVQAAEIAARSLPDLRIIIAGQGPEAARCQALVTEPHRFDWRLGFVPHQEMAALFAEAAVVVLPYRDASQSGVVPIAFANGRPVIATNVGALAEAVHDGRDGLLVTDPSAHAIAAAIVRLFSEDGLLLHLARGASNTASEGVLSPRNIAALHVEAYREAVRRARRP